MLGRLHSPGSSLASAPASTSMPPTRPHAPVVYRPAAATSADSEAHLRNRTLLARAPLVPLNLLLEKGGRHGHRHRRRNTRHHRPDRHLRPVSGRGVAPIHQQPRKGHEHDRTHRPRRGAAAHLRVRRLRILASWQIATEECADATLIVGPSLGSGRTYGGGAVRRSWADRSLPMPEEDCPATPIGTVHGRGRNRRMCTLVVNGMSRGRPSEGGRCGPNNDGVRIGQRRTGMSDRPTRFRVARPSPVPDP